MSVGNFAQSELNTSVGKGLTGDIVDADFLTIANDAVKEVIADIDLRGCIRSSALSPYLFDGINQYSYPTDAKGDKVIDVEPQMGRGRNDYWKLKSAEEFDRLKEDNRTDRWGEPIVYNQDYFSGDNIMAIRRDDLVNKLLLSRVIDDTSLIISSLDSLTAGGGTWTLFGDATNLTADSVNRVKGNASTNWDITAAGGTTAGIYNDDVNTFDVEPYKTDGSAFAWVYLSSATNVTNFILRIGSSSSAYYYITVTTNNEAASFYAGWNLLRFDFTNKSTTGTPNDDACDYVNLYMTKDAGKVSETDYRFDHIILKLGKQQQLRYYSRFGWQSSEGTHLEDATTTTDLLNCETDEYHLFVAKTRQRYSEFLKDWTRANKYEKEYEKKKKQYIFDNPSRALMLQQTY